MITLNWNYRLAWFLVLTFMIIHHMLLSALISILKLHSHTTVWPPVLDAIVKRELKVHTRNFNTSFQLRSLFFEYESVLQHHGLEWLAEENQKVCAHHMHCAVRPVKLRPRLKLDLAFSKHELKKYFLDFPTRPKNIGSPSACLC